MRTTWLVRLGACFWILILVLAVSHAANKKARKCLAPAQSGRCFGYVPSFAYNPFTRKCEEFVYGGCGGNENRFDSKQECELACRGI